MVGDGACWCVGWEGGVVIIVVVRICWESEGQSALLQGSAKSLFGAWCSGTEVGMGRSGFCGSGKGWFGVICFIVVIVGIVGHANISSIH